MICPRCHTNNPRPEATLERCIKCNFLLTGEVRPSFSPEVRRLARRRMLKRLLILLVVVPPIVIYAYTQEWFGILSRLPFYASTAPTTAVVIGVPPVERSIGDQAVTLGAEGTWSVSAIVFAAQRPDDPFAAVAPYDLVVGWGAAASVPYKQIRVSWSGRSAILSSVVSGSNDAQTVGASSTTIHAVPENPAIERALGGLKAGDRVAISGTIVTVRSNLTGIALPGQVAVPGELSHLLIHITRLVVNGRTVN